MIKYILVNEDNLANFQVMVNKYADMGYVPCGSFLKSGGYYVQPLFLDENKTNKQFTEEEVYRIVANFAISNGSGALSGFYKNTTDVAAELKQYNSVDFTGNEIED